MLEQIEKNIAVELKNYNAETKIDVEYSDVDKEC